MQENTIVHKQTLAPAIKLFDLFVPDIATATKAGQFVIVRNGEKGERIPLTIADFDRERSLITIVFQEVGKSTKEMGGLEEGDVISDVVGPLGNPSEIEKFGTIVCVGGGVGIAPVYPIARELKKAGNEIISIIGARSADMLIFEEEMRGVSDKLIVCTEDGSKGIMALVTEPLEELLMSHEKVDRALAIGPAVMMKFVCKVTKRFNLPTTVSLNAIMVDGTGMCGSCRLTEGGKTKFCCSDGPEFDGLAIDFDELMRRQRFYLEEEKVALDNYASAHGDEAHA